jgi:anaerobic ribonucleoside-triphosphate reductase activating protein
MFQLEKKNLQTTGAGPYLASVVKESIVDGPGLRMVLFTQGCPHRCPGCHNPSTHVRYGGRYYDEADLLRMYLANGALAGVTFSGGEPFLQGRVLAHFAQNLRKHAPEADIVTYTGYTLEFLEQAIAEKRPEATSYKALLDQTDLLIDGPFIMARRTLDLAFRAALTNA